MLIQPAGNSLMNLKCVKNQNGIALIEVIAAIGVSAIVIVSLVSLSVFTLRSSLKTKLILEASKQANKQMELIRAYRDTYTTDWATFNEVMNRCYSSNSKPICYINENLGVESLDSNALPNPGVSDVLTGFYILDSNATEVVRVNVVVQWYEAGKLKNTTLRSDFTNWQNK